MAVAVLACADTQRTRVACHVCCSMADETYLEARGYRIARCKNCGLWFVNPQPTMEELKRFYSTYDDGEQWRNREEQFNRGICKAILRVHHAGTILDVGCGSGNFLHCMKQSGFSAFGIEPSGTGSSYARTELGVDIYHGMIEDYLVQNSGRRFDVITLLNVLEHLVCPAETLLQLGKLLPRDGVLTIVVPDARFHNFLGRVRRFFGVDDPFWLERPYSFLSGFKLPDHLCSFQPKTIAALLRRSGFRVLSMQNAPVVLNAALSRNLAKRLVSWTSETLHCITFKTLLLGYSSLVLARKIPE